MIFEKDNVIYSEKEGIAILLSKDFDTKKDKKIYYKQIWNVWHKPHNRGKLQIQAKYDDWNGGSIVWFFNIPTFHIASKKLVELLHLPSIILLGEDFFDEGIEFNPEENYENIKSGVLNILQPKQK